MQLSNTWYISYHRYYYTYRYYWLYSTGTCQVRGATRLRTDRSTTIPTMYEVPTTACCTCPAKRPERSSVPYSSKQTILRTTFFISAAVARERVSENSHKTKTLSYFHVVAGYLPGYRVMIVAGTTAAEYGMRSYYCCCRVVFFRD